VIDLTRNIESTPEAEAGKKDPLWVSFIEKGENGSQFIDMLKSYRSAPERQAIGEARVNGELCINYQEAMGQLREEVVQKVTNRFKFYEHRKNKIIAELMSGERGELPEWSD
jgi:hypothetical protein